MNKDRLLQEQKGGEERGGEGGEERKGREIVELQVLVSRVLWVVFH